MTLIVSHLDRNGIVMASDSNLTAQNKLVGQVAKVFPVPNLNAGVAVAGSWRVSGIAMDEWMDWFIGFYQKGDALEKFVEDLRVRLQDTLSREELKIGTLIHVAGYVPDPKLGVHPEHWIVSNIEGIDSKGDYIGPPKTTFHKSEDFWRECKIKYRSSGFHEEVYEGWSTFANGTPSGRIAYIQSRRVIQKFLNNLWEKKGTPGWDFRPPETIDESRKLLELYMDLINRLFEISDSPAPYIGGEIHAIEIPMPAIQCSNV